jgi:branched-chain amino acid transport system permease protein
MIDQIIYHSIINIFFYIILSQSIVLVAGYTGIFSLAHAAFYGLGAYTAAILSLNLKIPFLPVLLIALLNNGLIGFALSFLSAKNKGDLFILITLGMQLVIFSLFNNWENLTNGPLGITDIPTIKIFGFEFSSDISFLVLTIALTALIYLLLRYITKSPFGLVLKGLSEDEIFTKSLGKNVYAAKVISFTIGAMLAAVPGVLYAHYVTYIDPTSFTVDESIFILSIVIIGGMRSLWGAAIAAAFLVILPEALRFLGMPNNIAANMRQIIYGGILVFMMFRYSKGFIIKEINQKHI